MAQPTLSVLDSSGATVVVNTINPNGTANIANSQPVALASDQVNALATVAKQPALGTAGTASADVITVQGVASMTALKVDGSAVTQPVSAASLPLPTGAATLAKQPALGTAGSASADVITVQGVASMTALKVDGSAVTQPVSAASLPLPSGASTAANQATANTSLSSIDSKITAVNTGAVTVSSSALPTGAATAANQVTAQSNFSSLDIKTPAPGQTTMALSSPVVLANNHSTIPVSAASLPLPTGASTSAKQAALGTAGSASTDVLSVQGIASMTALKVDGSAVTQPVSAASLPLPSGAATSAKQPALGTAGTASSDVITIQGAASMTAVATTLDQYAIVITSNTITRPSDTAIYAVGDLVANSTTAGSVTVFSFSNATRVSAGTGEIQRVRLIASSTSTTSAAFRVHFYNASPTVSNGDNGAWLTPVAGYISSFDLTLDKAYTDGAIGVGLPTVGINTRFTLPSGTTLYALLEARGTYTPTSAETLILQAELSRF